MTETHTSTTTKTPHPGDLTAATTKTPRAAKKTAAKNATAAKDIRTTPTTPPVAPEAASLAVRVATTWTTVNAEADKLCQELADAESDVTRWTTRLEEMEDARHDAERAWSAGDLDSHPDAPTPADLERVTLAVKGAERRLDKAKRKPMPVTDVRVAEAIVSAVKWHPAVPVIVAPAMPDLQSEDLPCVVIVQTTETIDDQSGWLSTVKPAATDTRRLSGTGVEVSYIRPDDLYSEFNSTAMKMRMEKAGFQLARDPLMNGGFRGTSGSFETIPGAIIETIDVKARVFEAAPILPPLPQTDRADKVGAWIGQGLTNVVPAPSKFGVATLGATRVDGNGRVSETYTIRVILDPNDDETARWTVEEQLRREDRTLIPYVGVVTALKLESLTRTAPDKSWHDKTWLEAVITTNITHTPN